MPQERIAPAQLEAMQKGFEAALPKIERVCRFRFRHLPDDRKDEATAEALAMCWKAYRRLCEQGRDPEPLLGKMAEFCARKVNSGGRLVGMQPRLDAMSLTAKYRNGHVVESLPLSEDEDCDPALVSALADRRTSPADEAAFNVDLAEWIEGLDAGDRFTARMFANGRSNQEVGESQGFGRGWGSLERGKLRADYESRGR